MLVLTFEPTKFFQARIGRDPAWRTALAIPFVCVVLNFLGTYIFLIKEWRGMDGLFSVLKLPIVGPRAIISFAVLDSLFYSAIVAGLFVAIICLDTLLGSGKPYSLPKLLEFFSLAWFSQLPYFLLRIALAVVFMPPRLLPYRPPAQQWMMDALGDYQNATSHSFSILFANNVGYLSYAWLIVIIMCGYYALSRSTLVRCVSIGAVLYGIFFVLAQNVRSR
jgi:hypothetical protein